jgi:hypothetical protein
MIQDQRKTAHEMIVANDTLTKLIENIRWNIESPIYLQTLEIVCKVGCSSAECQ